MVKPVGLVDVNAAVLAARGTSRIQGATPAPQNPPVIDLQPDSRAIIGDAPQPASTSSSASFGTSTGSGFGSDQGVRGQVLDIEV